MTSKSVSEVDNFYSIVKVNRAECVLILNKWFRNCKLSCIKVFISLLLSSLMFGQKSWFLHGALNLWVWSVQKTKLLFLFAPHHGSLFNPFWACFAVVKRWNDGEKAQSLTFNPWCKDGSSRTRRKKHDMSCKEKMMRSCDHYSLTNRFHGSPATLNTLQDMWWVF